MHIMPRAAAFYVIAREQRRRALFLFGRGGWTKQSVARVFCFDAAPCAHTFLVPLYDYYYLQVRGGVGEARRMNCLPLPPCSNARRGGCESARVLRARVHAQAHNMIFAFFYFSFLRRRH
jgi:hypothetical protein